jgi:hypothetical protein
MYHTLGISPKVLRPFILSLLAGATLYAIGMQAEARGMVAAAALALAAGYTAPIGTVVSTDPRLDDDAPDFD